MDSPSSKTIPTQKASFLRSQIRLLSSILQPSSTWRSDPSNASPADPLPPKSVDTVLLRLNAHLATHNRSAYPPQTQRHVAEQIDALYWSDVSATGLDPPEPGEVVVGRGVDMSTPEGFDALPESYEDLFLDSQRQRQQQQQQQEGRGAEAEAARYVGLRERLQAALTEQRRQRARLEGYRQLAKLLLPFEGAGEGVQPNLVGREGELGRELERMSVLVARVVGGIGELGGGAGGVEEGDGVGVGECRKLRDVMDVL